MGKGVAYIHNRTILLQLEAYVFIIFHLSVDGTGNCKAGCSLGISAIIKKEILKFETYEKMIFNFFSN